MFASVFTLRNCIIRDPPPPSYFHLMVIPYPQVAAADSAEEWARWPFFWLPAVLPLVFRQYSNIFVFPQNTLCVFW